MTSRIAHTDTPVAMQETRIPGDAIEISYPVPVTTGTPAVGQRTTTRASRPSARAR